MAQSNKVRGVIGKISWYIDLLSGIMTSLGTGMGITIQEENIFEEVLGQSVVEADIIYFPSFMMRLVHAPHLLLY